MQKIHGTAIGGVNADPIPQEDVLVATASPDPKTM